MEGTKVNNYTPIIVQAVNNVSLPESLIPTQPTYQMHFDTQPALALPVKFHMFFRIIGYDCLWFTL